MELTGITLLVSNPVDGCDLTPIVCAKHSSLETCSIAVRSTRDICCTSLGMPRKHRVISKWMQAPLQETGCGLLPPRAATAGCRGKLVSCLAFVCGTWTASMVTC